MYYKALREDMKSFYDGKTQWTIGKPVRVKGAEKGNPCGAGIHLGKSIDGCFSGSKFPVRIFRAEPIGEILGEDENKIRVAGATITKEIRLPKYLSLVNKFMVEISTIPWLRPDGKPDKKWKLFSTWDAAWDAARAAAGDAAGDAAWAAAGDAAWAAARAAAGDAAWAAAGDAARAAAGDAALMARLLICDGLKIAAKHRKHILARWRVWQKGYGLTCDVNGVLYVYERIQSQ